MPRSTPYFFFLTFISGGTLDFVRPDLNAQALGIGGLDKEFNDIFRRAFVTRLWPASFIEKLGIKHVKGILQVEFVVAVYCGRYSVIWPSRYR